MGATIPAGAGGAQHAAELMILLVYLSESLGRLGQNGGHREGTFFIGGGPLAPRRTAPALRLTNSLATVKIVQGRGARCLDAFYKSCDTNGFWRITSL